MSQTAGAFSVEVKREPRESREMLIVGFQPVNDRLCDPPRFDDVAEFVVQSIDKRLFRIAMQSQHQTATHVAHAVVDRIEPHDFVDRFFNVVGHSQKRQIFR